jgi:uncharacterized protein (DUF885 family)
MQRLTLGSVLLVCAIAQAQSLDNTTSELRPLIERFSADLKSLERTYAIHVSDTRRARFDRFYSEQQQALGRVDFKKLSHDGQIDYILFRNLLDHERRDLQLDARRATEAEPLMPFGKSIVTLEESRKKMDFGDPQKTAADVAGILKSIEETRKKAADLKLKPTIALRAASRLTELREVFKGWYGFYNGYDPNFTWWVEDPYKKTDKALEDYIKFLRETLGGANEKDTITGDPAGRDALVNDLSSNMVPYTPEELLTLARKELAWGEQEMIKASREMGFGDDWKRALEKVKTDFVKPGEQPALVRKLAQEAIDYVVSRDLVTVPELAKEDWWEEMLSPERQKVAPFFLGGDLILVAFPTNTMTQEEKLNTLRGNNIHFARATVFHELIPGHHLQGFMMDRWRAYRAPFYTPFWQEGNSFYWEMLLWDQGFAKTPEDRIGMLFWRMHRAARIIFSISFHLEQMTAQECVDFLVNRVGFERENAAAEVRRSFDGSYPPIYQSAYMLGALQFYALHRELTGPGKMTEKAFHDALLQHNAIPIELLRAALTNQPLTQDFKTNWRFYDLNATR